MCVVREMCVAFHVDSVRCAIIVDAYLVQWPLVVLFIPHAPMAAPFLSVLDTKANQCQHRALDPWFLVSCSVFKHDFANRFEPAHTYLGTYTTRVIHHKVSQQGCISTRLHKPPKKHMCACSASLKQLVVSSWVVKDWVFTLKKQMIKNDIFDSFCVCCSLNNV